MKLKIVISAIVILIIVSVSIYLFYNAKKSKPEAFDTTGEMAVNELPNMVIDQMEGKKIQAKSLVDNDILVFYLPECDHCMRTADSIRSRLNEFEAYTLYFITTEEFEKIDRFARDHQLAKQENVLFGRTTIQSILDNYGQISTPSIYIYRQGKLIKGFDGETPIEQILEFL